MDPPSPSTSTLVMSVNPGFGGQRFLPGSVAKVAEVAELIGDRPIDIEVDGGVGPDNAPDLVAAGATALVAGSAVFRGGPDRYGDNIAALAGTGNPLDPVGAAGR